jgi:hypothetical protein
MPFAISSNASLAINAETVWGTPLTTGAKFLRVTGFNNKPEFSTTQSAEINAAHRETADLIRTSQKGSGSIEGEMIFDVYHTLMESVFGSAFSGNDLKLGKTRRSFTLQENYSDLTTAFVAYRGCVATSMGLSVAVGQPIRCNFGFVSKAPTVETASVIGTVGAANTNDVMNPMQHISLVQQGGASIDGCQSFEFSIQNEAPEISSLTTPDLLDILLGRVQVTGTFSVYKQANARYSQVLTGAATTLALSIGAGTKTYAITMPNVKIQSIDGGASGSNPIMERFGFTALYNATDSSIKIVKGTGL